MRYEKKNRNQILSSFLLLAFIGAIIAIANFNKVSAQQTSDADKWITLLCAFNDGAHPTSPYSLEFGAGPTHPHGQLLDPSPHFQDMYDDPDVGLENYFAQNSFGRQLIDGDAVSSWQWLPHGRVDDSYPSGEDTYGYIHRDNGFREYRVDEFLNDCVAAHDNDVDFSDYDGINFFPSRTLLSDIGTYTPSPTATMDTTNEFMYTISAHRTQTNSLWLGISMGQVYGMTTSWVREGMDDTSYVSNNPYQNNWDVVSTTKNPCYQQSYFNQGDFGCMPQYSAAYQRAEMGWLTDQEIIEVEDGEIKEVIIGSASDPLDGRHKMIEVVNQADTNLPYTIELRSKTGLNNLGEFNFDRVLPPISNVEESSVVIHLGDALLDTDAIWDRQTIGYADTADEEARWTVNESYISEDEQVKITVLDIDDVDRTAKIRVCTGDKVSNCDAGASESSRWVVLLCAYNDHHHEGSPYLIESGDTFVPLNNGQSEIKPLSFYEPIISDPDVGMKSYFHKNSFGRINLDGSTVSDWEFVPHGRRNSNLPDSVGFGYVWNSFISGKKYNWFINDCMYSHDDKVDYTLYDGIVVLPSRNLLSIGLSSFTPTTTTEIDGNTYSTTTDNIGDKTFQVAIVGPVGHDDIALFGHEMGHTFGLYHSSVVTGFSDYGYGAYTNAWDVQSGYWHHKFQDVFTANELANYPLTDIYPSQAGLFHPDYGALPPYASTPYRYKAGWMTEDEIIIVEPNSVETITIGSASEPLDGFNKMIQVVHPSQQNWNYAIELRTRSNMDLDGAFNFDRSVPPYEVTNGSTVTTTNSVIVHLFATSAETGFPIGQPRLIDIDADYDEATRANLKADPADEEVRWTQGETFINEDNNVYFEVVSIDELARTTTIKVCTGNQVAGCQ